jgi:hypothetical protein
MAIDCHGITLETERKYNEKSDETDRGVSRGDKGLGNFCDCTRPRVRVSGL